MRDGARRLTRLSGNVRFCKRALTISIAPAFALAGFGEASSFAQRAREASLRPAGFGEASSFALAGFGEAVPDWKSSTQPDYASGGKTLEG